jgi:hypothetical protein
MFCSAKPTEIAGLAAESRKRSSEPFSPGAGEQSEPGALRAARGLLSASKTTGLSNHEPFFSLSSKFLKC